MTIDALLLFKFCIKSLTSWALIAQTITIETITKQSGDILNGIKITINIYLCHQSWAYINKMRIEILTYVSFI